MVMCVVAFNFNKQQNEYRLTEKGVRAVFCLLVLINLMLHHRMIRCVDYCATASIDGNEPFGSRVI